MELLCEARGDRYYSMYFAEMYLNPPKPLHISFDIGRLLLLSTRHFRSQFRVYEFSDVGIYESPIIDSRQY